MQTLNVGAGRTDTEYKAAEEQRQDDLRTESQTDANYFFWAAGLAALGTGLLPIRLNILCNIGTIDHLAFYGRSLGAAYSLVLYAVSAIWISALIGLGFAARNGNRWAFLVGIFLYAGDMIPLIGTFSLWAFSIHSFFVFKWFQGQRVLSDLKEAKEAKAATV